MSVWYPSSKIKRAESTLKDSWQRGSSSSSSSAHNRIFTAILHRCELTQQQQKERQKIHSRAFKGENGLKRETGAARTHQWSGGGSWRRKTRKVVPEEKWHFLSTTRRAESFLFFRLCTHCTLEWCAFYRSDAPYLFLDHEPTPFLFLARAWWWKKREKLAEVPWRNFERAAFWEPGASSPRFSSLFLSLYPPPPSLPVHDQTRAHARQHLPNNDAAYGRHRTARNSGQNVALKKKKCHLLLKAPPLPPSIPLPRARISAWAHHHI